MKEEDMEEDEDEDLEQGAPIFTPELAMLKAKAEGKEFNMADEEMGDDEDIVPPHDDDDEALYVQDSDDEEDDHVRAKPYYITLAYAYLFLYYSVVKLALGWT